MLDGVSHQDSFSFGTTFHGDEERQRRLAFAKVVADVLSQFSGGTFVVEQIVDKLESGAQ